jgi:hypothetical protein
VVCGHLPKQILDRLQLSPILFAIDEVPLAEPGKQPDGLCYTPPEGPVL